MRRNVFHGHVLGAFVGATLAAAAATQYLAYRFRYPWQFGEPLFTLLGVRVYPPWGQAVWTWKFGRVAPDVFTNAVYILAGGVALTAGFLIVLAMRRMRYAPTGTTFGTARWANHKDLMQAGLLPKAGVVLCQSHDAELTRTVDGKGVVQLGLKKRGLHLLRHNGPEHVLFFAPTRSGKGVALVIPSLLSWTESALIYDLKGELFAITAGWRRQFSHVWRFDPTSETSVRYNPLLEVRKGVNEVRDTQNIAELLVDPDGAKPTLDHWQMTASTLLVGAILHVLYAEKDKSLAGLYYLLSDPARPIPQVLQDMMETKHLPTGPHPVVATCARQMLNKSENELSSVVSTAMTTLKIFQDPLVARNTSVSDFRISDLMNGERPVSLYLVTPPSDTKRLRPLVRLMLNQIGRRLSESMDTGGTAAAPKAESSDAKAPAAPSKAPRRKWRLLYMLDECASLGKLPFLEEQIAYLAGYGIKLFLIWQDLNQIDKLYGNDNAIFSNCHIRGTYAALDEKTAKRISELLGTRTEVRRQRTFSGKRIGPWLGNVSDSDQEHARPLLTPGEVLQLPADEALMFVGGSPPYRGKKVLYFADPRFKERANLKPPFSARAQAAELHYSGPAPHDWGAATAKPGAAAKPTPVPPPASPAAPAEALPEPSGQPAPAHLAPVVDFFEAEPAPPLAAAAAVVESARPPSGRRKKGEGSAPRPAPAAGREAFADGHPVPERQLALHFLDSDEGAAQVVALREEAPGAAGDDVFPTAAQAQALEQQRVHRVLLDETGEGTESDGDAAFDAVWGGLPEEDAANEPPAEEPAPAPRPGRGRARRSAGDFPA